MSWLAISVFNFSFSLARLNDSNEIFQESSHMQEAIWKIQFQFPPTFVCSLFFYRCKQKVGFKNQVESSRHHHKHGKLGLERYSYMPTTPAKYKIGIWIPDWHTLSSFWCVHILFFFFQRSKVGNLSYSSSGMGPSAHFDPTKFMMPIYWTQSHMGGEVQHVAPV